MQPASRGHFACGDRGVTRRGTAIDDDAKAMWKAALRYSAVGLEMGVAVAAGYLLGWWLDRQFAIYPYGTLGGLALGIFTAFRAIFRVAKEYREDSDREEDDRQQR